MKRRLIFATNNKHKLEEISAILGDEIELLSLKDINCNADIPTMAWTALPMIQVWKWKP